MKIRGKCVVPGKVIGESVVNLKPISFLGDIDPNTGDIIAEGHPLNGVSIANKIFPFPFGKGSTVGSYVIYQLFKNGKSPSAIINKEAETIVAVGAIISGIPMIHRIDINAIPHGAKLEVNATKGIVKYKAHLKK